MLRPSQPALEHFLPAFTPSNSAHQARPKPLLPTPCPPHTPQAPGRHSYPQIVSRTTTTPVQATSTELRDIRQMLNLICSHLLSYCRSKTYQQNYDPMDNKAFIISCWNIQGLRSSTFGLKSRNTDFNSEIKNSDIIILQETWSRDGPTGCPKGYRELIIPSTKLPGVTQGRDSGGMLIWYRSNLAHAIKVAKTGQFCTWLEINKTVTTTEKNIFLCATYIPPAESPYFNEDSFSILEVDINYFQSQGSVLLCGDLNARTGEELDTLNPQGDTYLTGGDIFPTPIQAQRHNYDKTTNKSGTHLLHLCRTLGLFLVNGRLRGDSYGRYTYSLSFGSSTVEYFLTDLNPNSLRAFTVSPLNPLSDHSKITLYLNRAMPNTVK